MKKICLALIATLLMTGAVMAQQYGSKKLITPIASESSVFGVYIKAGDFIYIEADSSLYMAKINMSAATTGAYMKASSARYSVAKFAAGATALSLTTLAVSGTSTLAGALTAAGAIGFGVSNNKFTVAAATGNTAIAGTLAVTGASTLAGALNAAGAIGFGTSNNKFTVAAATGNTAIAGTLSVAGATITMPGGTTLSKTADNANSVTTSGSLVVGGNDTLTTTRVAATTGTITTLSSTSATVGTTLTLPGGTTMTKTTGNANSVTTSGSLVVGGNDTLTTTVAVIGGVTAKAATSKLYSDSLSTKRILVSDTLQGVVIYNSAGVKYRFRVSPTGVLSIVAVP